MNLTKERKVYAAVFAVAIGGLAVDRFVLSGETTSPSAASANLLVHPSAVKPGGVATPVVSVALAPVTLDEGNSLAHRLEVFAQKQNFELPEVVDAFKPDHALIATRDPAADAAPKTAAQRLDVSADFARRHKLTAVMTSGGEAIAIVDGRVLRVGEVFDHFLLKSVAADAATFEKDGQLARLELKLDAQKLLQRAAGGGVGGAAAAEPDKQRDATVAKPVTHGR